MSKRFSGLSAKLSIALIAVIVVFMAAFTIYLVQDRAAQMNDEVLAKGIAAAATGATVMGRTLDGIVDEGLFTTQEVFDHTLVPIPLSKAIAKSYGEVATQTLAPLAKYHYATTLDSYLDNAILEVEDQFLRDPQIAFAALVDENGYLPTHNSRFSQQLSGDLTRDRDNSRTKRLFNDPVGLAAAQNVSQPYLKQVYQRDTGEQMWDISAPVFVKGRHWGAFRIGLSMDKAAQAIADLRWKMLFSMGLLLIVLVVAVNRITALVTQPLRLLHRAVARLEQGDLSEEEIARLRDTRGQDEVAALSRVFAGMAVHVKARETQLRLQVEELRIEIDHSKRAKHVAEITGTDYFQNLRKRAQELRSNAKTSEQQKTSEVIVQD